MCVILERQEAFIVYYTCGIAPYSNTLIILAVRQMSSNSVQVRFLPLNEFRSGQVLPPNKLGGGGGIVFRVLCILGLLIRGISSYQIPLFWPFPSLPPLTLTPQTPNPLQSSLHPRIS